MGIAWTDERLKELKRGWDLGLSATIIAERLGGVTRNAVLGKVHRLGLPAREPRMCPGISSQVVAAVSLSRTSRSRKTKVDPVKVAEVLAFLEAQKPSVIDRVPAPKSLDLTLMELFDNNCRYAVSGEKQHMLFCGNAVDTGSRYCTYHHKLCHGPGTKSERLVDHLIRKVA